MRTVRKQARPLRAPRRPVRERKTSLEAFARLDRSAMILLIFGYCLIHWAIRCLTAPVFTIEEADELLFSQSFQLGYTASQPPMVAWLNAVGALAGPNLAIVQAIKYALMFQGLVVYYLAARNVLVRPGVSAAAVAAWALTFEVGWGMHEDGLGAVALMAALSLALHAVTRILTWRRPRDWGYLGFAIGIGLLTHHLFFILPLSLIVGIAFSPFFRDALSIPRLLTALIVAGLIYSPYVVWVMTHVSSILDAARQFADSWQIDNAWLERVKNGGISFGMRLVEFTLPLSLFWLTLFWPLWLPVLYPVFSRRSTDEEPHEQGWRQLFARSMGLSALIWLVGVLAGVQVWKSYWMLPVLFTAPIWMFAHVKRAGEFPIAIRAFAAVAIMFVAGVVAGRFVEWRGEIVTCDEAGCKPYAPIAEWSEQLKENGFNGGTIVGADRHLTGNLRGAFPKARVLDASVAATAFPPASTRGACLAVWRDYTVMPEELADYMTAQLGAPPKDRGPEGAIRRNLRLSTEKAATLYFQFVPPSEGCR